MEVSDVVSDIYIYPLQCSSMMISNNVFLKNPYQESNPVVSAVNSCAVFMLLRVFFKNRAVQYVRIRIYIYTYIYTYIYIRIRIRIRTYVLYVHFKTRFNTRFDIAQHISDITQHISDI
jgi:hypothetical protein